MRSLVLSSRTVGPLASCLFLAGFTSNNAEPCAAGTFSELEPSHVRKACRGAKISAPGASMWQKYGDTELYTWEPKPDSDGDGAPP